MEEQPTNEQTQEESKKETVQEKSIVEIAEELRDEIRAEKEQLIKEREQLQKAQAEQMLSGQTNAGEQPPQQQKEESPSEYTKRIQEEMRTGTFR